MNTYYTSLSGMFAASYGLQNTSNNIANMQSPGFKRRDLYYASLGQNNQQDCLGGGVFVGGTSINFSEGHYLETGNPSHLAIVGQGFFIVRLKNGELLYTRDGEFDFNKEGVLTDKHSGGYVQAYTEEGKLTCIKQKGPKTAAGKASRFLELAGDFVLIEKKKDDSPLPPDPGIKQSKYEPTRFEFSTVYDAQGKAHQLTLEFEAKEPINNQSIFDGLEWELTQVSYDGKGIDFQTQDIKFSSQSDGYAEEGANDIELMLPDAQALTLKLGNYMSDSKQCVRLKKQDVTNNKTEIIVNKQDGYGEGKQISLDFDDNGQIRYTYDNGQILNGDYIALAKFSLLDGCLIPAYDNLFRAKDEDTCTIGRANKQGFGAIQSQKLESSNVDSTTEFANIVVLQRMFQACSQIMEIDKQLLEELYK